MVSEMGLILQTAKWLNSRNREVHFRKAWGVPQVE